MNLALIFLIRAYQWLLSPLLGPACRFEPSCSAYAEEALRRHGAARGSWLAIKRLGRCHPLCRGGIDPVPERTCDIERLNRSASNIQDIADSQSRTARNAGQSSLFRIFLLK